MDDAERHALKPVWSDSESHGDWIYVIEIYAETHAQQNLYPWLLIRLPSRPGASFGTLVGHGEGISLENAKQDALSARQAAMMRD